MIIIKKGFTYIELMVSIAIFLIIFAIIMKLNNKSYEIHNTSFSKTQLIYFAQLEIEQYKSSPIDFEGYKETSIGSNIYKYYVSITSTAISSSPNLKEVTVHIGESKYDSTFEKLQCHIITN